MAKKAKVAKVEPYRYSVGDLLAELKDVKPDTKLVFCAGPYKLQHYKYVLSVYDSDDNPNEICIDIGHKDTP